MKSLYNLFIASLKLVFSIGRHFNGKLNQGYKGRQNWRKYLTEFKQKHTQKIIWFHCASLGEFEMARPVIDEVKEFYKKEVSIIVTFFSPSGYELRKNYKKVDGVMYLPFDTRSNAKDFVALLKPDIAVFVKYEFWLNLLKELKNSETKTLLINGLFRREQSFFKWWGGEFRAALKNFDHLFLQNNRSKELLNTLGIDRITVTGDLRYDRVLTISASTNTYLELEQFCKGKFVVIGGSTWPEEEKLLKKLMDCGDASLGIILAPHDIADAHLIQIEKLFNGFNIQRFSMMKPGDDPRIVLVDTIGHLSSIYKYGNAALVGGGFTGALHNILEPAVFSIPVFFGSMHSRFPEAKYFMENGIGFGINNSKELSYRINEFRNVPAKLHDLKVNAARVFKANSGGTHQVFYKIKGYLSV